MTIAKAINKLRTDSNLSQQQFAELFDVSQQSVQKWENGDSVPELSKIIKISKHFGVSLDALILGNDARAVEEMKGPKQIKPQYQDLHYYEVYSANLLTEYKQCCEEGLDIEIYKDVFSAVSRLPQDEIRKKLGDVLFEAVINAQPKAGYRYNEPSGLEAIKLLTRPHTYTPNITADLKSKIHGAWIGRICGCLLGRPLECILTDELIPFLKETGNYPMHRYVLSTDVTKERRDKYKFSFPFKGYADTIDSMQWDDDTNYTVLYQEVIQNYGKDFTPFDVSRAWLNYQKKDAYCTAERVAYCNFVNGYVPPDSAVYKNPSREWIGAQIRADYFGYINPGNPQLAAEMAWRDACVSHVKNGIYGEMFVAAMLAVAARTNCIEDIIRGGLAHIPYTSRLYEQVMNVMTDWKNGVSGSDCFKKIHLLFDEANSHDWCHTISNAMVVAAALLYGGGDYSTSICMAVEAGFDTDCNGATVGSILGMANGIQSIPEYWYQPINDTLHTTIFGVETVKISDRVELTLQHIG